MSKYGTTLDPKSIIDEEESPVSTDLKSKEDRTFDQPTDSLSSKTPTTISPQSNSMRSKTMIVESQTTGMTSNTDSVRGQRRERALSPGEELQDELGRISCKGCYELCACYGEQWSEVIYWRHKTADPRRS